MLSSRYSIMAVICIAAVLGLFGCSKGKSYPYDCQYQAKSVQWDDESWGCDYTSYPTMELIQLQGGFTSTKFTAQSTYFLFWGSSTVVAQSQPALHGYVRDYQGTIHLMEFPADRTLIFEDAPENTAYLVGHYDWGDKKTWPCNFAEYGVRFEPLGSSDQRKYCIHIPPGTIAPSINPNLMGQGK